MKNIRFGFVFTLLIILFASSSLPSAAKKQDALSIHFLDAGQGDSILIRLPDGKVMLIDGGPGSFSDGLVGYISNLKVKTIDYVIATHPHEDHIGGLPAVFDAFDVKSVYLPNAVTTTKIFEHLLESIDGEGISIGDGIAGVEIIDGDDLNAAIISPVTDPSDIDNLNNASLVIKLTYGDNTFLFAGDVETDAEALIKANIDADVLKVGHHGSTTSTSKNFLKKVTPDIAVITVGEGNDYGHPHDETLKRLKDAGTEIYRTDLNGTVIITSDGTDIIVETSKTEAAASKPVPSPTAKPTTAPTAKPTTAPTAKPTSAPTAKPTTAPETDEQSVTVYVTKTGEKYHASGCRYLSKSKIPMRLEDARKQYEPCSVCNPPR